MIFGKKGVDSAEVQRSQGLQQMIAIDHRAVKSAGEFIDGPDPEIVGKRRSLRRPSFAIVSNLLQGRRRKGRFKDRGEFRYAL